jgi:hypothetical protein
MAGKGDRARHTLNDAWRSNYELAFAKKSILRDTECCGDVGQDTRCDNCSVCDRERPNMEHATDSWRNLTKK